MVENREKGSVTIFITLIISVMLILFSLVMRVISLECHRAKVAIETRGVLSDVKSTYNSYIFENYHILLFDNNCNGEGEGALEQMMEDNMSMNLGENYCVKQVAIAGFDMIYDNHCAALKDQIEQYAPYGLAEYGIENILQKTDGQDGTLSDELAKEMETAKQTNEEQNNMTTEATLDQSDEDTSHKVKDPRKYTKDLSDIGLLYLVLPEGVDISAEAVDMSGFPSLVLYGLSIFDLELNQSFDDYGDLKHDVSVRGSWMNDLKSAGLLPVYANQVFNSFTTQVNENTAFKYEREYLIHGGNSDINNLRAAVNQLIALRLSVNYGYLLTDKGRMAEVTSIAMPLSIVTLIPEPILKYLLAGCWSFVESIVDVRTLLSGKKVPFKKSSTTWKTDIHNLEQCEALYAESDEDGMSYDDYLVILMLFQGDVLPYRMLDLMQINAKQENENFSMLNAAVGLRVDISVEHDGEVQQITQSDGY